MPADRMQSLLDEPGTAGTEIEGALPISETQTVARLLTEHIGFERRRARVRSDDYQERHEDRHFDEWTIRTRDRGRAGMQDMIEELAELGFAWRDVARMIGVSVPAVQKWRRGEGTTGDNRQKVAGLLAACDLVADHYAISEVASWFEMPIRVGTAVTPIDLWADGQPRLVFEHASGGDARRRPYPLGPRLAGAVPVRLRGVRGRRRAARHPTEGPLTYGARHRVPRYRRGS